MFDAIETRTIGAYTVEVFTDESGTESPRDWDNLGTFWTGHNRYNSPDAMPTRGLVQSLADRFNVRTQSKEAIESALTRACVWLPVWLYDHSETCYRAATENPFSCPWDSGLVGYIFVTKATARAGFGRLTKANLEKVYACLQAEVSAYSAWANGEVYGFVVTDSEGEQVESCWDFVGELQECLDEGISIANHLAGKE